MRSMLYAQTQTRHMFYGQTGQMTRTPLPGLCKKTDSKQHKGDTGEQVGLTDKILIYFQQAEHDMMMMIDEAERGMNVRADGIERHWCQATC